MTKQLYNIKVETNYLHTSIYIPFKKSLNARYNGKWAGTGGICPTSVCFQLYPDTVLLYRASTGPVQLNVPRR